MKSDPADSGKALNEKGGLAQREIRTCPTCGTKFSATADSGICPVCILLGSVDDESEVVESPIPVSESEGDSAKTEHWSIDRRFEHYEVMLDEDGEPIELGRGAMGITYKAFDVDLRIPVTLISLAKVNTGSAINQFRMLLVSVPRTG